MGRLLRPELLCLVAFCSSLNEDPASKTGSGQECGRLTDEESEKGLRPWMAYLEIEHGEKKAVRHDVGNCELKGGSLDVFVARFVKAGFRDGNLRKPEVHRLQSRTSFTYVRSEVFYHLFLVIEASPACAQKNVSPVMYQTAHA